MNTRYRILKEQNLILRYYSGKLTLDELYGEIEIAGYDKDYLPSMYVINDIRDCQILFEENDVIRFVDKVKQNKSIYDKRKVALLTATPNQVVFSTMIELFKKESFIDLYIVSTLERAMKDLMIPESNFSSIKKAVEEIRMKI